MSAYENGITQTDVRGRVANIQRLCNHDGPGLRTTVFLKGCPLKCSWCHNPEAMSYGCEIGWETGKCIGCHQCVAACEREAVIVGSDRIHIDKSRCTLCGACINECPTCALVWYGRDIDAEELFHELKKDRAFFCESGGGITLSGGEPLMQPDFSASIMELARSEGISIALDTSCYAPREVVRRLIPLADIVLIDIKIFDSVRHKEMTGVNKAMILENIDWIARYAREECAPKIYLRTPLIPGCTADEENVMQIGNFIREVLGDVLTAWELLLFHNMCVAKYEALERLWQHADTPLMTNLEVRRLQSMVDGIGIPKEKIKIQGLAVGEF